MEQTKQAADKADTGSIGITHFCIMLIHCDHKNPDFLMLVSRLDAELAITDGADHAFYHQFNQVDRIAHALVAYADGNPVACGALRAWDAQTMEVKRMYTLPDFRGRGLAAAVLAALELWAAELGYARCILETGVNQHAALRLYPTLGYRRIPNYGVYAGVVGSVCMEKWLPKPKTTCNENPPDPANALNL